MWSCAGNGDATGKGRQWVLFLVELFYGLWFHVVVCSLMLIICLCLTLCDIALEKPQPARVRVSQCFVFCFVCKLVLVVQLHMILCSHTLHPEEERRWVWQTQRGWHMQQDPEAAAGGSPAEEVRFLSCVHVCIHGSDMYECCCCLCWLFMVCWHACIRALEYLDLCRYAQQFHVTILWTFLVCGLYPCKKSVELQETGKQAFAAVLNDTSNW
jgi:hypothetical protein